MNTDINTRNKQEDIDWHAGETHMFENIISSNQQAHRSMLTRAVVVPVAVLAWLVVLPLLTGSAAHAQCDVNFSDQIRYAAGDSPRSVALGDLDGDGDLDMVVANTYSGDTSVLLNNGDGSFADQSQYDAGHFSPSSVSLGDLDGDGDLDMAVTNSDGGATHVLYNNGDGTFTIPIHHFVGEKPVSVSLGDLDGDGDLDMVVANRNSNDISVLLNHGGTFFTQTRYTAGDYPQSVSLGDLDGDGDLDIVVANYYSNVTSVLLGNGNGTFAARVSYAVGVYPRSVQLGDLDGDGDMDMVVANYLSNDSSVLMGNGDSTFASETRYTVGYYPGSIVLGDVDGDGDLDMVVANFGGYPNYDGDISVLLNNGDGTFTTDTHYTAGDFPSSVALGDLDGDGDLDMAIANYRDNNVSVLLNTCHTPPCPPDLNDDGVVNTADFLAFLLAWSAGNPLADWNNDDVIDTRDFLAYLNDWVAGCP